MRLSNQIWGNDAGMCFNPIVTVKFVADAFGVKMVGVALVLVVALAFLVLCRCLPCETSLNLQ